MFKWLKYAFFQALIEHQMLNAQEEKNLLNSLFSEVKYLSRWKYACSGPCTAHSAKWENNSLKISCFKIVTIAHFACYYFIIGKLQVEKLYKWQVATWGNALASFTFLENGVGKVFKFQHQLHSQNQYLSIHHTVTNYYIYLLYVFE